MKYSIGVCDSGRRTAGHFERNFSALTMWSVSSHVIYLTSRPSSDISHDVQSTPYSVVRLNSYIEL